MKERKKNNEIETTTYVFNQGGFFGKCIWSKFFTWFVQTKQTMNFGQRMRQQQKINTNQMQSEMDPKTK